ncbi:hypothetical protein EON65_01920 [archaeon]|nr:MAG: hypothetical protein EON65_01920 [archaeon]
MGSVPTKSIHTANSQLGQDVNQPLPPLSFASASNGMKLTQKHAVGTNNSSYVLPEKDHIDIIKQLIGAQVNVGSSNDTNDSFSPLFIACHYGLTDVMSSLIAKNADINTPDCNGFTPLYIAAYKGHTDLVRTLLQANVHINAGKGNITPLFVASRNGHEEVVKLLLDKEADIDITTDDSLTPYEVAASIEIKAMIHAAHESRGLGICAICWESPVNASCCFIPCNHKIVCKGCNEKLLEKNVRNCPMCRSPIWGREASKTGAHSQQLIGVGMVGSFLL